MDLQLRASEWGIGDDGMPILIKPCGCRVPYRVWRNGREDFDGFNFAEHTCKIDTSVNSLADLQHLRDRMLHEVREEDGEVVIEFTKLYRRKRQYLVAELASLQEQAYRAVMELADRLEQELQVGPYSPLTVELMTNLANEHYDGRQRDIDIREPDHDFAAGDCLCSACEEEYWTRVSRASFNRREQIVAAMSVPPAQLGELPVSIEHDPLKRSYYIRLDADGRRRTHDEMVRDVQAGLVKALTDHQQEFAAKLLPNT